MKGGEAGERITATWTIVLKETAALSSQLVFLTRNILQVMKASFGKDTFILPNIVHSLKVENCRQLNVLLDIAGVIPNEMFILNSLMLYNIGNLTFLNTKVNAIPPYQVILENITNIDYIPSHSFFNNMFDLILLRNVTINHVESEAFMNITILKSFMWDRVHVGVMNTSSISNVIAPYGEAMFQDSTFGVLELVSVHLAAPNVQRSQVQSPALLEFFFEAVDLERVQLSLVTFNNCRINDMRLNALNVIADKFVFVNNSGFKLVMPRAFSIQAREISLIDNDFEYLQTGAFESISPAMWYNSSEKDVSYTFRGNNITIADAGGLHVDLYSYNTIQAKLLLDNNLFLCSCTHLGWLAVVASPGDHMLGLQEFHKALLDPRTKNMCWGAKCNLPINVLEQMVQTELCFANMTNEDLCNYYYSTNQPSCSSHNITDVMCIVMFLVILVFMVKF
uniref:Uncharacterized protein n=1 Tax=Timema bartmani TaxID=61472 RepID=A0A7R9F4D3_9NEOP|nr:unnamed protein product [Timema bartmani]